jgi:hypothetical protein
MNTGKNRVKGLKTELFKKKYQTDPMVKNPTDMLGIPDITKDISNELGYKTTPYDWGTGAEPNVKLPEYNPVTIDTKAEKAIPDSPQNTKVTTPPDWRDAVRMGVGTTSAIKGIYDDVQTRQDNTERIQNLNDRPRYMPNEYEYMAKPGSQGVIYAKHGAEIRTGTDSGAEEAELERGEMFMMPNMDTYIVGGKKHSQGGENFVLPEGTIVFSDHLKVPGLSKTFSDEAKKYDVSKYKKILDNPHAKSVDRSTAEILLNRNMKKLQELFQIQQEMNGNSTGEMEPKGMRKGQFGMGNPSAIFTPQQQEQFRINNAKFFGPNAPVVLTPEQQKGFYLNQGMFNNPGYSNESAALNTTPEYMQGAMDISTKADEAEAETQEQKSFIKTINDTVAAKAAAAAKPNDISLVGGTPQATANTAANMIGASDADPTTAGTVGKTNAADDNSMYYKTLPNGRKVFVENQGDFKGKQLRDQYGGDVFKLVSNRLNENYDQLNPLLLSAYQMQLKDKNLMVGSSEELIDIMKGGNNSLVSMRNFYKGMNMEDVLFDPALDKGADNNMLQAKTAQLFKDYVESPQFVADVKAGKASSNIPWLKKQPTEIKDAKGNVTGYKLDSAEMSPEFTQKYQAAYRAFGGVKGAQSKLGKDKDMLRGFRIDPEGLSDHQWMGLPISPVDLWGGNTTIGQISAFEDEEPPKSGTPKNPPGKTTDGGKDYETQLGEAPKGKYTKAPFDYPQLAPELYGMAASQMFAYSPMDYDAPYVMPQTLNIQPQLQDIDSSYMAAMNAGGDPNTALIATLGAKQKLYSEKQNFDAQQRAQVDQVNAQARWQEDVYDMQSLDRVYNTLIAQADDAVTAQRQALVKSASDKRSLYNMEENKKKLYIENFVRNYKVDGKTGSIVIDNTQGYNPLQLEESYYQAFKTEEAKKAAQARLDKEKAAATSQTTKTN